MTINSQGLYDKNLRNFLRFFGRHLNCQPIVVGRGGFEPPKSKTSDLQSDPFGRSGICPYEIIVEWSRRLDLNPQPADYKSAALPIELHRHAWCLGAESCDKSQERRRLIKFRILSLQPFSAPRVNHR